MHYAYFITQKQRPGKIYIERSHCYLTSFPSHLAAAAQVHMICKVILKGFLIVCFWGNFYVVSNEMPL